MMNEANEPDGDYDPIGTELQGLRLMIGDLDARLAALEPARAEPPATCADCGHAWARHDETGCTAVIPWGAQLEEVRCACVANRPQETTWPTPDCAAEAETLPVVECVNCEEPATRLLLFARAIYPQCECKDDAHQYARHQRYITGEPAARILHAIAREAARVQGGAG